MNANWPRISIITPSFNQAAFLERTILSVLGQNYPNLEYIIIDGGSTDGSLDIIRRYASHLSYWVSEPDRGQAHAINKGLQRATGEWVAWQNSDDIYYPGAFNSLASKARSASRDALLIGNMNLIDSEGRVLRDIKYVRPTYQSLLAEGMVLANQAAFWRRDVHEVVGYLNESFDCGFDYDWFLRLLMQRTASHVNVVWGGLRSHQDSKTHNRQRTFDKEFQEITEGRVASPSIKRKYQIRRAFLMMAQGDLGYVLRGCLRRLRLRPIE